ncbi:adiponectin receptor protein-like [Watersipora subatra]|uniref:adiponectin receptor protein-like n=1 Tax=Watersipora subatra TaxID=2589382 RepID=UPI00355B704E
MEVQVERKSQTQLLAAGSSFCDIHEHENDEGIAADGKGLRLRTVPDTPQDTQNPDGKLDRNASLHDKLVHGAHKVEEVAHVVKEKIYEAGWRLVHHAHLPDWMRDNEYIHHGHRPELRSFLECFKSVFRIHTETGNIWTHLLGMVAFIGISSFFISRPNDEVAWEEKAVFSAFFVGAIICLGFSWIFHTVACHSSKVGKFFNKLDYCGISILTVGSFIPWLYYCFYCRLIEKVCYLVLIFTLGSICTVISLLDKFQTPRYRPIRAGMFIALGLSGVIPAMHFVITDGLYEAVHNASLGWLVLMAFCYIFGAVIYAVRIPERIWPGKFDIWFQSHQIFHVFVIAGAMIHYHGITQLANYRLGGGDCLDILAID